MKDKDSRFCPFPTTHWSLVDRAADDLYQQQREALNELLTQYWPALKNHLVGKKGMNHHEADDLVQGFIKNRVLESNLVAAADRSRGKFRGLLTKALENYVANELRRRRAKKRHVEQTTNLDADYQEPFVATTPQPSQMHDAAWARDVLTLVLVRMQAECLIDGREDLWGVFETRVASPLLEGAEPVAYDEIVDRYGFSSSAQAQNALVTAKRMFCRLMRAVLRERGTSEDDIESEIQDLEQCLAAC